MLNWHPFWNHLACVERSAWQEKSRSAKQQAKKTAPTRRPKIWISFPESPQKTNVKGKKKERNFQPLQSDHYGLLEVNQPVPLPQSLFDGFPHGIRPFFSTKSSSQSKAPIYGPPVQRSWCLLLLGGLKTPKRKKGNGCIPFVGISFLGFVKSPKKKKTTKAIQSSRKFSSSSSSSSPLSPPALAGDSSCRITEKNSSAKKWGTKMSYVNFSKWFYNECIYGILCICIYNII